MKTTSRGNIIDALALAGNPSATCPSGAPASHLTLGRLTGIYTGLGGSENCRYVNI
jgi:hypothetical protein